MRRYTIFIILLLAIAGGGLHAQSGQVEFGKNRVQYHNRFKEWMQYESENFITYWYGDARNIGQFAVQMAEYDFRSIQNILEHQVSDKIEIIVYTDITDLKQSNIGVEEAFVNTGGQTKIAGNKMFVYFDGDHQHLRHQIREGIAGVFLNAILFGSNLQEMVQNAVMLNLPEWFKQGLIAYCGEEWNSSLDNELKNVILSDRFRDFRRFSEANPKLAGHAFWYFIAQNYGKASVSNLLYLTRINRSMNNGFLYVLGTSYEHLTDSWYLYFKQRYEEDTRTTTPPTDSSRLTVANKRKLPVCQVKLSPNGQKIAYVTNEIGRAKVYVQDVKTGKRELVFKTGARNLLQATDYNYPLLAWKPNGQELTIVYESRDVVKMINHDLNTGRNKKDLFAPEYQRVFSLSYMDNHNMVISAAVRGFSDIFIYKTKTRQSERITNDFYDDLDAAFVNLGNTKGILFASNRPDSLLTDQRLDTILPVKTLDIFYYDLEKRSGEVVRITHTPNANERQPFATDTTWLAFLTDVSGIVNRQTGFLQEYLAYYEKVVRMKDQPDVVLHPDSIPTDIDSTKIDTIFLRPVYKKRALVFANTNYDYSILAHDFAPRNGQWVDVLQQNGKPAAFYLQKARPEDIANVRYTRFGQQRWIKPGSGKPKEPDAEKPKPAEPPAPAPAPEKKTLTPVADTAINTANLPASKKDTGKVNIDNYLFQSEFDDEEVPPVVIVKEETGKIEIQKTPPPSPAAQNRQPGLTLEDLSPPPSPYSLWKEPTVMKFRTARIIPYRLKFRTDYVTTQLDNSLLFGGLDNYAGFPQGIAFPPLGILLKANFKDLLEDYEIETGVRVPTTFNGAEYFLWFKDKKKQLDKTYALYRRSVTMTDDNAPGGVVQKYRVNATLGSFQLSYPFDVFTSLRLNTIMRFDRITRLSTENVSLKSATINQQRIGCRLEYVYDNTLDVAINIKNGTRYKFFGEFVKRFDIDLVDKVSFELGNGYMGILGFDARHYQRLDRFSILAFRAAAATSFGTEKIQYFLGGVSNWLFPSFNNDIPRPAASESTAYQTPVTDLRGFKNNIRNGNSYALFNTELRVPVFRYLSSSISSAFLRNFQVVGFFDIGTAWTGASPFKLDNPLNTSIIQPSPSYPVIVKVNYFREPLVAGYGIGARTVLFGYFLRADYAWGIETRVVQKPIFYLSMGLDF